MRTKSGPDVIALSYCLHQLKPLYYTFVKKTVLLNVLLNYCHVDRFVNKLYKVLNYGKNAVRKLG